MSTRNDITGDALITKSATEAYRAGWDRIFRNAKDRLAKKEQLNFDYGKLESRCYLPIIDLSDQKSKMLSISMVARKELDTVIEQYLAALESDRLLRAQAEAARHFKRSKLFYGAKR